MADSNNKSSPLLPADSFMGALVGNEDQHMICVTPYSVKMSCSGIWDAEDSILLHNIPRSLIQIFLIAAISRLLHFLLRPLKQPRIVCDIASGIIVGSFVTEEEAVADKSSFSAMFIPEVGKTPMVVLAAVGLIFNLFIAGVKMDPSAIWKSGRRSVAIGTASLAVPLAAVVAASYLIYNNIEQVLERRRRFFIFMAASLCTTSFPVLADILAELRLLNTELGRLALSSAMIQDVVGWIFMVMFTAVNQSQNGMVKGLLAMLCFAGMGAFALLVFRPYVEWVARTTPVDGRVSELHVFVIMLTVVASSLASDAIGGTFIDGPIILGLVVPDGPPLGAALVERVEPVASEVMLPLFFLVEGVFADVRGVAAQGKMWLWMLVIMLIACVGKIAGTVVPAVFCDVPLQKAVLLGLIMNFRGLVEMIVFFTFINGKLINGETYTMLVFSVVGATALCVPLVAHFYKPLSSGRPVGRRTVQHLKPHVELRMLACFSDERSVPPLLHLLECSSPPDYPSAALCVYALHLVELQGRAVSSLVAHRNKKGFINPAQMDRVHNNFITFEQVKKGATAVQPFTSIAPYKTMHQDVCSLALEKSVALVVVPFPRKDAATDGDADRAMRGIVPLVLSQAPCSVGVLIHHNATRIVMPAPGQWQHHVCVLFWGGPDDREALSVAARMARHPAVRLTVMRFVLAATASAGAGRNSGGSPRATMDKDRVWDEEVLGELRVENGDNKRLAISEVAVRDVEQTVALIRTVGGDDGYDLVVTGRRQGSAMSLLDEGLSEWSESPELGVVGDMLASSDFQCPFSVLVVQQHS
ncbi:cation/H(+) antiporter 15-like [Ananas comosus]|uniref:Cation/H(+) antiporter 15-like n=1 Tax=Ananas comosus TaxID=4615 RepID=A0A6P5FBS4_ANACO|nr:cation/H(+) antiporter 15-like [Ananas comosus]